MWPRLLSPRRFGARPTARALSVVDMRTAYLSEPLGLDNPAPRFSWAVAAENAPRGLRVRSYQLDVFEGDDVGPATAWTSGVVASAVTHNVPYGVGGSARAVPLKDGRRYVWRVRVTTTGGVSVTSPLASFTMGLGLNPSKKRGATGPAGWTGQFIGMAKSANESAVAPWFRKTFFLAESDEGASSALLFVASVGFCEVTVNGKPASEAVLSPSISFLPSRVLYRTYSVGHLLRRGANNTIGLWASAGWADYMSFSWAMPLQWKTAPLVMAELHVNHRVVEATDSTWSARASSTSRIGNWGGGGFGGDLVNSSLEVPGWDTPELVTTSDDWNPATIYPLATNVTISADVMEPTVRHSTVAAASITPSSKASSNSDHVLADPRNYTITMSELFTGWFEIKNLKGAPHGTVYFFVSTTSGVPLEFSMKDGLVLDGSGIGNFRMRFSYHEIHYITISGLTSAPALKDITGWRLSIGLRRTGQFVSSNSS